MRRFPPFLALFAALFTGAALWVWSRPDPRYTLEEWLSLGRYNRYDAMITDVALKHGMDPHLIKAVVWQESRFHPGKTGSVGERGLMQIGEAAATDWARAHKIETFRPTDLFAPRTNLEIGTWYLHRALRSWSEKEAPLPFALAEYNAGRRHVHRWIRESGTAREELDGETFRKLIAFPSTRAYIRAIERRYEHYRQHTSAPPQS